MVTRAYFSVHRRVVDDTQVAHSSPVCRPGSWSLRPRRFGGARRAAETDVSVRYVEPQKLMGSFAAELQELMGRSAAEL